MADRIPVLLEGGPCDGRKTTAREADFGPVSVMCKGTRYEPTSRTTKAGRLVYTTAASQQPPPTPSASDVAQPLKAHHAWHGMLVGIFVEAPKELVRSASARKAIRHLTSRHGLR